jgi:hypothetical protein
MNQPMIHLKPPKKLTIRRSQWLRGEGSHRSCLLRSTDSKMCCLGFYALAVGCTSEDIADVKIPSLLEVKQIRLEGLTERGIGDTLDNSSLCWDLVATNDNESLGDSERERKLTALFQTLGTQVQFID